MNSPFKSIKKLINQFEHIHITTHLFPDADGIGSQIALYHGLSLLGKNVICINEETLLDRYHYLDMAQCIHSLDHYKKKNLPSKEYQLLIVVDTNTVTRIGPKMMNHAKNYQHILFLDHHPPVRADDMSIPTTSFIDTSYSSTGELAGSLLESFDIEFTYPMALPLYTAIMIDTNSFRYPQVGPRTHELIAKLLKVGVMPAQAYNQVYGTKKIDHFKLLGETLQNVQASSDGTIAWIVLSKDLSEKYQSDIEDTHSFVNYLLTLDQLKVACFFRETDNGIKLSLRSNGSPDVGELAKILGGGGHNHSAATIMKGKLDTVIKDTISKISEALS